VDKINTVTRIITRPDFDGVVCALLLKEALGADIPVRWVQPNQIQDGGIALTNRDAVANLPINDSCALWFDHHVSNEIDIPYQGLFRIAPSAAGLVFEFFKDHLDDSLKALVKQADKIDAAQLNLDEIRHPEKYPYILLSMTIATDLSSDFAYCDRLVDLLGSLPINEILKDDMVRQRCNQVIKANRSYETDLIHHTRIQAEISITDFRECSPVPNGNRFLVYSLFPETVANVKIFDQGSLTVVKLGHSIVNRGCRVNVGRLLAGFGGGGHFGAGACRLPKAEAEESLVQIIDIMTKNLPGN
jgi:hypothetical protein